MGKDNLVKSSNIFNHLHVHSEYSFRDAISKINAIVDAAIEMGSTAIALTDHGNMHGAIEFYKCCKKKGIKGIVGCEMYVIENKKLVEDPIRKHEKFHILFLAKDNIGYHQIANAVTRGQLLKDKDTYPRVTYEDISEIFVGNHVICLSACVNGEIAQYLSRNDIEKAKEVANFYKSVFGEDYYFEIQDHNLLIEMEYQQKLIDLSVEMNIPLVATNDAHYIKKEDYKTREMIVALRWGKTLEEIEPDCQELYMKNYDEMYQLFYQWPEALENTIKIAEKCNIDGILVEGVVTKIDSEENQFKYNLTDIPETLSFGEVESKIKELMNNNKFSNYSFIDATLNGMSNFKLCIDDTKTRSKKEKDKIQRHLEEELGKIVHIKHFPKFTIPEKYRKKCKNEKEYITFLAYENFSKKYPSHLYSEEKKKAILDRINYELEVICDLHYEGYLLIVADFINKGKTFGLIGPGRGSAVGSIICYLIGITNVDPLPFNLIFERFLNKDRVSDPDIDTDFAPMIRELVIDYVKEIYGSDSVCQIVTFGSMGAKAAIRNAGRVYNIPIPICDKIAKMIPNTVDITLDDAINGNVKKEIEASIELNEEIKKDEEVRALIDAAKKIEGIKIQTGIHAAGVIIADKNVSAYCPMSFDTKKKTWVTQFEKNSCEHDVGLLKMDFLGLENLNIIYRTIKDIEKNHGIVIDIDNLDYNNEEEVAEVMREIFEKGRTKGIFQFESDGMVNYLKQLKPKTIEDLILLNAAYRPGPLQYIPIIIDIINGRREPSYICDSMKDILGVTHSKPIYQEQIQQIFNQVAGFSLGEADIIRRAMAKKKVKELEAYFPLFKQRLTEQGVTIDDANTFCDELMDFAKYAFNKSHATAYTIVAYQTAWLKHFYPVEYMANLLTSATVKTLPVYINECKSMGIEVLPPDINTSGLNFTPTKEGTIRFGLKIKNAGSSCEDILKDREQNGEYKDVADFTNRMIQIKSRATHSNVLNSYVLSGAFDSFGLNRHQLYDGMLKCVSKIKDINAIIKKQEETRETIEVNTCIIDGIYPKYSMIVSQEEFYDYAKKYHKHNNSYQKAIKELNNKILENGYTSIIKDVEDLDNAEFTKAKYKETFAQNKSIIDKITKADGLRRKAFPSLYLVGLNIEEDVLFDDLENYCIAQDKLSKVQKTNTSRDLRIQDAKVDLNACIDTTLKEYDRDYILDNEKEILGFYASGHPLDSYKRYIEDTASVLLGNIDTNFDKNKVIVVGKIKNISKLYRKADKKEMCKFDFEDLTGEISAICFTKPYAIYRDLLTEGRVVVLTGRVDIDTTYDDDGELTEFSVQLNVSSVEPAIPTQKIYIKVRDLFEWEKIKPIVENECSGENALFVYFENNKKVYQYATKVTSYDILKSKLPDYIEIVSK